MTGLVDRSRRHLKRRDDGARPSKESLQVRADAYANGTLKPRDDIAAYADMHALARTELGRAWPPRLVELYLQALAAPLDAAQLAQARARGEAVWRECCASGTR